MSKLHWNLCLQNYFRVFKGIGHKLFLVLGKAVPFFYTLLVPKDFYTSFVTVEVQQLIVGASCNTTVFSFQQQAASSVESHYRVTSMQLALLISSHILKLDIGSHIHSS